jgi:hypothetical protein
LFAPLPVFLSSFSFYEGVRCYRRKRTRRGQSKIRERGGRWARPRDAGVGEEEEED